MTVESIIKQGKSRSLREEADLVDAVREFLNLKPLYSTDKTDSISNLYKAMIIDPVYKNSYDD